MRNVESMEAMFSGNTVFNKAIGSWDVSSVRNMQQMFQNSSFNRDISRWDVSSVTDMSDMFGSNTVFNQDLTAWNSKLCGRTIDAQNYYTDADAWEPKNKPALLPEPNQQIPCTSTPTATTTSTTNKDSGITFGEGPLGHIANIGGTVKYLDGHCRDFTFTIGSGSSLYTIVHNKEKLEELISSGADLSKVVTTCVRDMSRLFYTKTTFNEDISSWDTSNVTTMLEMFEGASDFNQDISEWDTSRVTNMRSMFYNASDFNRDLEDWDTSRVTDMSRMFSGATSFNGNISLWNVSNVTDMASMFQNATSFNGNISLWNVSNVTIMNNMFDFASAFNQNISGWDVSKVTNIQEMFYQATGFNQDLTAWNSKLCGRTINSMDFFNGANAWEEKNRPTFGATCP